MMSPLCRLLSQAASPLRLLGYTWSHGVNWPTPVFNTWRRILAHSAPGALVRSQRCSSLALQQCSPPASFARCGFHSTAPHRFGEDHQTKTVAIWSNLRELKASPYPALMLGVASTIPFVVAPMYMVSLGLYIPHIAFAQLTYGAVVLSFIGGIRWGFVIPEDSLILPDWENLGYSLVPPFIAWSGLLMPPPLGMLAIMVGLGISAYADLAMYGYPPWFKGFRFVFSVIAILCMWSTAMCALTMKTDSPSKDEAD